MDYIHIDALRVLGKHGYHEYERTAEQEFEVSLRVGMELHKAGGSDALEDTLDYSSTKQLVIDVFARHSRYLIEALAEDIAAGILQDPRVAEVSVTIKKVAIWDNGVPGVTINRFRIFT